MLYIDESIPFYYVDPADPYSGPEYTARTNFQSVWNAHAFAQNQLHLLGGEGFAASPSGTTGGITDNSSYHYSYIYVRTIESTGETGAALINHVRSATVHELSHQFGTNSCTNLPDCSNPLNPPKGQHDDRGWWQYGGTGCPSANPCLMDPNGGNPTDGVDRLCIEDILLGDPNCSGTPRPGAIRTRTDPLY